MINSLTQLVNVKHVASDVLLVPNQNIIVTLVSVTELLLLIVHVHKDFMKLITNLSVELVAHNVLNVKPPLVIVFFVLQTESNLLQNVLVNLVNLILLVIVLLVTSDVKNVKEPPPIVTLVLKTESMLQLVYVQMDIMKKIINHYVLNVMINVINVSIPLITV
jgi:hypothetical protein